MRMLASLASHLCLVSNAGEAEKTDGRHRHQKKPTPISPYRGEYTGEAAHGDQKAKWAFRSSPAAMENSTLSSSTAACLATDWDKAKSST
jgi:hypothetical protein